MSHLAPYNLTISDQSPLFQYLPFRDGPIQSSWNVTYAGDADSAWVPNAFIGAGVSPSVISEICCAELFDTSPALTGRHLWVHPHSWTG
jgi:hypothetical protein